MTDSTDFFFNPFLKSHSVKNSAGRFKGSDVAVASKTVRDALLVTGIFCYPKIPYVILVTMFSKGRIEDVGHLPNAGLAREEPALVTDTPDSEAQFQRFVQDTFQRILYQNLDVQSSLLLINA